MEEHELAGLILDTDLLLEQAAGNEITIPEPNSEWEEKLKEYREAELPSHLSQAIHEMRVWQTETLGFKTISNKEISSAIMGEPHTDITEEPKRNQ